MARGAVRGAPSAVLRAARRDRDVDGVDDERVVVAPEDPADGLDDGNHRRREDERVEPRLVEPLRDRGDGADHGRVALEALRRAAAEHERRLDPSRAQSRVHLCAVRAPVREHEHAPPPGAQRCALVDQDPGARGARGEVRDEARDDDARASQREVVRRVRDDAEVAERERLDAGGPGLLARGAERPVRLAEERVEDGLEPVGARDGGGEPESVPRPDSEHHARERARAHVVHLVVHDEAVVDVVRRRPETEGLEHPDGDPRLGPVALGAAHHRGGLPEERADARQPLVEEDARVHHDEDAHAEARREGERNDRLSRPRRELAQRRAARAEVALERVGRRELRRAQLACEVEREHGPYEARRLRRGFGGETEVHARVHKLGAAAAARRVAHHGSRPRDGARREVERAALGGRERPDDRRHFFFGFGAKIGILWTAAFLFDFTCFYFIFIFILLPSMW